MDVKNGRPVELSYSNRFGTYAQDAQEWKRAETAAAAAQWPARARYTATVAWNPLAPWSTLMFRSLSSPEIWHCRRRFRSSLLDCLINRRCLQR